MAFSEDMESVGKFAFGKVWVLLTTILRIWLARVRYRTPVLYYPPSGPNKVPVLRDIVLLCSTRWLFSKVAFHFHAGGVSGFEPELPAFLRPFFRFAYRRPALSIRTAPQNPEDGKAFGAQRDVVVPNGIEDTRGVVRAHVASDGEELVILFTGVLIPSKGVSVLLHAFAIAAREGINARLQVMGKWGDAAYERECLEFVNANGLEKRVEFLGVKRDKEKFNYFACCDVFCFPSFFEAESFGLVLVEAMQFGKPVVSTRWRGIPSVVSDERSGFLVDVQDPAAVAEKLLRLAGDPALRRSMGAEGRRIFEQRFTLEAFHRSMERELMALSEQH
ncbi:MAG: glycosyltransferase family 4 protein [Flavobacteriales bacterium]|nr:glycosyltransferase family 4 protein [Flavobacteriales bacterium]